MKWIKSKISDLIEEFERGISYSSEEIKDNSGVPMMNLACIDKTGFYREGELKFFSGNYSEADKVYPNDMLVACTDLTRNADIIGTPILVPSGAEFYLYTMDLAKLTPKANIDKMFLYYALKTSTYRKYIKPWASGTTVLHLNLQGMYDYELYYPEKIDDQQKLAQILADIDSKISLNKQINQNLEALAKQLYDYWFVQFDFPDENGKPYKSSGGAMVYNEQLKREIPKGWKVKQMDEVIEIRSGFPFQSSTYLSKGKYRIITIKNVQDGYLDINDTDFIEELPKRIPDYCILKKGDTLVSLTGNIGRVGRVYTTNLLLNQRVGFVDCKIGFTNWAYLFLTTTQIRQQIEKLGIGSAQSNVSPIQIGKIKMVLPPLALLSNFEQRIAPMLNQIISNSEENCSLIKQRNELLPLLMNGQVNFDLSVD